MTTRADRLRADQVGWNSAPARGPSTTPRSLLQPLACGGQQRLSDFLPRPGAQLERSMN